MGIHAAGYQIFIIEKQLFLRA